MLFEMGSKKRNQAVRHLARRVNALRWSFYGKHAEAYLSACVE